MFLSLADLDSGLPDLRFEHFGGVDEEKSGLLSFASNLNFLKRAKGNRNIKILIIDNELKNYCKEIHDIEFILSENPRSLFYYLLNRAFDFGIYGVRFNSYVSTNVVVGKNSVIEDGVIIEADVKIGCNCVVKAGSIIRRGVVIDDQVVIGSDGLQTFVWNDQLKSVAHVGGVEIGAFSRLYAKVNVSKSLYLGMTRLGDGCQISIGSSIGHGSALGKNVQVSGGVVIGGSTVIGDESFIGPGAIVKDGLRIGKRASIKLGAVVINNIDDSEEVSGNFAKRHSVTLREHSRMRS